jgi:hypothetical protein
MQGGKPDRRTAAGLSKDGRLICIAPGDQDDVLAFFAKQAHAATDGGRVAIGRVHPGAGGVVHSYEEALNALDLADRLKLEEPVLRTADLFVYPVLTRDQWKASGQDQKSAMWQTSCPGFRTLSVSGRPGCVS